LPAKFASSGVISVVVVSMVSMVSTILAVLCWTQAGSLRRAPA
jgi:hypothetical protein